MQEMSRATRARCERILALHVVELSTELRQHDAANLIALIQLQRFEAVRSLVDGDCEFLFQPSTMRFGSEAEVSADWTSLPTIALSMEFSYGSVEVYFRLVLEAREAGVEIDYMRFERATRHDTSYVAALHRALSDARSHRSIPRYAQQRLATGL